MTNNQLTDERVTSVIERLEHYACNLKWTNVRGAQDLLAAADGLRELQERRKAAMDSEPVAWTWHYREQWHVTNDKCRAEFVAKDGDVAVLPLYRHAQPAPVVDREPIAWLNDAYLARGVVDGEAGSEDAGPGYIPVYREAGPQPAPVVPKSISVRQAISALESVDAVTTIGQAYKMGWNACRAAMLQGLKKSAGTEAACRSNENAQVLNTIKAPPDLGSLPKTVEVLHTNSPEQSDGCPEQSDGCPAQNCIHSAQGVDSPIAWHHSAKSKEGNHGTCCFSYASSHDFGPGYEKPQSQPHYLPERLDYDRALHFLSTEPRKVTPETVISGNSPAIPDCWCRTCRPVVLNDMRFVVCPDCGNKRCPRANDHRNACTGSNEPGQEGNAYPDTPREVKP